MKNEFLKMAGVTSEADFYKKYPTEDAFFNAFPQAKQMAMGGMIDKNVMMQNQYGKGGQMIKRKDGSYSRRGLWDNIRANRGSGKKPTKEMLKQERKIKAKEKAMGGEMYAQGGSFDNPGFKALPEDVQMKIMANTNAYGGQMYAQGGNFNNAGFQALPPEVQAKIKSAAKAYGGNMYAMGGELPYSFEMGGELLQSIDNGGTHEMNPNGGVPATPDGMNLVEEGETVFDGNFVFSNRLKVTAEVAREFSLGKKAIGKSYAEVSKMYQDEERPNDRFNNRAAARQLENLAEAQESYKAVEQQQYDQEVQGAQEALAMQQMQEQMAQQMAQPMGQEQMMQQQMMQQMPQQMGYGGKIKYAPGGPLGSNPANPEERSIPSYIVGTPGSGPTGGTFGNTRSGGTKFHGGIDVRGKKGDPLYSHSNGVIVDVADRVKAGEKGIAGQETGNYIVVKYTDQNGEPYYAKYAHLDTVSDLNIGDEIDAGSKIGTVGNTGNAYNLPEENIHVHIETSRDGRFWPGSGLSGTDADSRIDPMQFFTEDVVPSLFKTENIAQDNIAVSAAPEDKGIEQTPQDSVPITSPEAPAAIDILSTIPSMQRSVAPDNITSQRFGNIYSGDINPTMSIGDGQEVSYNPNLKNRYRQDVIQGQGLFGTSFETTPYNLIGQYEPGLITNAQDRETLMSGIQQVVNQFPPEVASQIQITNPEGSGITAGTIQINTPWGQTYTVDPSLRGVELNQTQNILADLYTQGLAYTSAQPEGATRARSADPNIAEIIDQYDALYRNDYNLGDMQDPSIATPISTTPISTTPSVNTVPLAFEDTQAVDMADLQVTPEDIALLQGPTQSEQAAAAAAAVRKAARRKAAAQGLQYAPAVASGVGMVQAMLDRPDYISPAMTNVDFTPQYLDMTQARANAMSAARMGQRGAASASRGSVGSLMDAQERIAGATAGSLGQTAMQQDLYNRQLQQQSRQQQFAQANANAQRQMQADDFNAASDAARTDRILQMMMGVGENLGEIGARQFFANQAGLITGYDMYGNKLSNNNNTTNNGG